MSKAGNSLYSRKNSALCLTASAHLIFCIYYDYVAIKTRPQFQWAGKFVYLTFWNLCIETLYFCFAVLENISTYNSKKTGTFLRKIRDFWFITIIFPLSLFVSITFWCMYTYDRELLVLKSSNVVLPAWFNHSIHTFVGMYSIVELFTTYHSLTTLKKHLCALWFLSTAYALWSVVVWHKSDTWAYPFINHLSWPGRLLFFIATEIMFTAFLFLGFSLNKLTWRKGFVEVSKKSKKKR